MQHFTMSVVDDGAEDVLCIKHAATALNRVDTDTLERIKTDLTFKTAWLLNISSIESFELVSRHFFIHVVDTPVVFLKIA